MNDSKLELYGGFTAYFDDEENAYMCKVPWFAREVSVRLSGGDYDEVENEGLKRLFEKFWKDRDNIYKKGKEDIIEKLLPYMAEKKTNGFFNYPILSADDFEADYWLTLIQIAYGDELWNEVHLFFGKLDDEDQSDELCVKRDLYNGHVSFNACGWPIDDIDKFDYSNMNNNSNMPEDDEKSQTDEDFNTPLAQVNDCEFKQVEKENQLLEEYIEDLMLEGTDRMAIVKTRVNQGVFRDLLIRKYKKCCLCGADEESLLVASHIKPWADSTRKERVDVENGLLLCPNHDKLFDRGFITFNEDGGIVISDKLSETNQVYMNVNADMSIPISETTKEYMQYHREKVFLDK